MLENDEKDVKKIEDEIKSLEKTFDEKKIQKIKKKIKLYFLCISFCKINCFINIISTFYFFLVAIRQ